MIEVRDIRVHIVNGGNVVKTLANFKRPKFGTHEELEKYRKTLEDQYNHDYGDNDHKAHVFFKYAEKCTDLSQS